MIPDSPAVKTIVPVISLLRPDQIDAAVELFGAQLKEHMIEADSNRVRSVIETVIADERRGFILVAATGRGQLVGVAFGCAFLGVEHGGESGWLEELYVLPEWRQQGVGTRLVSEVVRVAKVRGWRAIDLEVEADHQRVVSLYARHGFLPHSRSRYYRKLD
jgi:ribosomal protein S18 acetylase RimI-like enzyme